MAQAPRVTLVAKTAFVGSGPIDFRTDTERDAEKLVEFAGRLCYMSFGKGRKTNREYIAHLVELGHGSVLEHPSWTFLVEGVSRALSHELVRHRHLSFSQLSQRFVAQDEAEFVEPEAVAQDAEAHELWRSAVEGSRAAYKRLVARLEKLYAGVPEAAQRRRLVRQAARSVLPHATETKVVVTGNARAWRHFIGLRGSGGADVEIRRLAVEVLRILQREAPHLFGDFEVVKLPDGTEGARTPHPSV